MISPAQQLLEKLLQKSSETSSSSPLILFQYSCHVSLRETAAITRASSSSSTVARTRVQQQQQVQTAILLAQADLYKRAQLRTPAEDARRATWGGPLWIEYLTQELTTQSSSGIVWVSTTTRPVPQWIDAPRNSVVSATFLYQTMWEEEATAQPSEHPLSVLLERIRAQIQTTTTCTPIVIESLTPFVQIYGFSSVFLFLQKIVALPQTLLLLPVLSETLTAPQHQQLEDLAHTALWLSNHTGQVDLHVLRRGIREQDSTVREIWDFSLTTADNAFSLVVGKNAEEEDEADAEQPDQVNLLQAMNPALNGEEAKPAIAPPPQDAGNKIEQKDHFKTGKRQRT